jgi:hypothetical protein
VEAEGSIQDWEHESGAIFSEFQHGLRDAQGFAEPACSLST